MSIGVMLFNPFTGTPRHPDDIKSDPDGILVWDGEAKLRAAKPAQPDCRTCDHEVCCENWNHYLNYMNCTNGDKYMEAPKVVLWRTE